MTFKPYCEQCQTWHTEREGHRIPETDEICDSCKYCHGPIIKFCGNSNSEFFEGPVLEIGWCPEFERDSERNG